MLVRVVKDMRVASYTCKIRVSDVFLRLTVHHGPCYTNINHS